MKEKLSRKEIAQIEKAIEEKYGSETLKNPHQSWNQEKEREYLSDIRASISKEQKEEIEEMNGFVLEKKLFIKQVSSCPICDAFGMRKDDEVFLTKYECCQKCYVQYVEGKGREEVWEERKKKILSDKVKHMDGE